MTKEFEEIGTQTEATADTNSTNTANRLVVIAYEDLQAMIRRIFQEQIDKILQDTGKPDESKFMTRKEACEELQISLPTLGKRMRDGEIQYRKLGRRILIFRSSLT